MKTGSTVITQSDLDRLRELRIKEARAVYAAQPFITRTYMAMRGFPMEFLKENWDEITKNL